MNRYVRVWVAALALCVSACSSLPPVQDRMASTAFTDTVHTRLGLALAPALAQHAGKTGVHALADPRDAFVARAVLAAMADRSIDVEKYRALTAATKDKAITSAGPCRWLNSRICSPRIDGARRRRESGSRLQDSNFGV